MTVQKYIELPWDLEDTIENFKELKEVMQQRVIKTNLHGRGEKDAEEVAFDFDRAINALEKQIPYKPKEYEDKYYGCRCGNVLLHKWEKYPTVLMPKSNGLPYCLKCGQKLDWSDTD